MKRNLLLVSNTSVAGGKKFEHARREIDGLFSGKKVVTFIPYANPKGMGYTEYTNVLRPTFRELGLKLKMVGDNPVRSIHDAEAIYIGGGNTWALLKGLKEEGLLYHIREAVDSGVPYLGSSAGSNVAGLTIGNTNDMPGAEAHGRDAIALVSFNVNPHYQDPILLTPEERVAVLDVAPQLRQVVDHQGETRQDRVNEYHALGNKESTVAMREGAMLRVRNDIAVLKGKTGGRLFRPGRREKELEPGADLSFLLSYPFR